MPRFTFLFVTGLVCLCAMPLAAQDAVLSQMYGNGVHSYFGMDYAKAYDSLTSAIDGKTQDPRAYYFRGLALLKLGRPEAAESDFKAGAKLESAIDPSRAYNIARALERIQGSDRSMLEQYRLKARMTVLENAEKEHALRYQQTQKEQRDFLQKQSDGGPAKPLGPGPDVAPPAAGPAAPDNPFDAGKAPDAGGAKPADAVAPPPAETPAEKPVVKPNVPKAAAGGEDPFGAEAKPATPAATAPATKPAPAGVDDPFGGDTKPAAPAASGKKPDTKPAAGDDPFGAEPKPAAPAASGKKPDTKPAAGGDDPFGADAKPAAPAATKPDAKPAAGGDDPFGGDTKPATPPKKAAAKADAKAPPAGDDPFGADAKPAAPAAPAKKPDAKPSNDDPFSAG